MDGNPEAPGLKEADKSWAVDIRDKEKVYQILDKEPLRLVLPVPIGRYLTTTGAVNERYGLPGVSQKAAEWCTDKYLFHEKLAQAGLRHAEIELFPEGDLGKDQKAYRMHGPVIMKPRYGSGSRGVRLFDTADELGKYMKKQGNLQEDYLAESFVEGREFGVDGVYQEGEFGLVLLREKLLTRPPYRQCVGYYSVTENETNRIFFHQIKDLLGKVGNVLGLRNCLIHADIIQENDGTPFLIELSARPSGHYLSSLFTGLATGVDMLTEYMKENLPELGSQSDFAPKYTKPLFIKYFDFTACRIKKIPEADWLKEMYPLLAYECSLQEGMALGNVTDGASVMGRGYYILEGENREVLRKQVSEIEGQFQREALDENE